MNSLYSIGHSNITIEEFLSRLKNHDIKIVVDVRSSPFSRYCPWFSNRILSKHLESVGINYLYLGAKLGGRPTDTDCYDQKGVLSYEQMLGNKTFHEGIDELLGVKKHYNPGNVVFMCSEANPSVCHRGLLISRKLSTLGVDVLHITKSGTISHSDLYDVLKDEASKGLEVPVTLLDEWLVYNWHSVPIQKKVKLNQKEVSE